MSKSSFRTLAALLAAGAAAGPALAQQADGDSETIVVTGNPLGREALAQPAASLAGDALLQRRAGTLGDTLDGLPGAAASRFGPNSSRPVMRPNISATMATTNCLTISPNGPFRLNQAILRP